ncbi:MAG: TonB-dependent receptor [Pseudomonadota bacterium]
MNRGPLSGSFSVYYDDFDDFIFQAGTGLEEDGLPLRLWAQQDAEFKGGEIEFRLDLGKNALGSWQLFGFYDQVQAELSDGSNVPLIPPQRLGVGVDWAKDGWRGNVTWINADDHTDTAAFETRTPGYDLLNAELSYKVKKAKSDLILFFKGQNLLDEDIRYSTSTLKDDAPQIGRNLVFGVRINFP